MQNGSRRQNAIVSHLRRVFDYEKPSQFIRYGFIGDEFGPIPLARSYYYTDRHPDWSYFGIPDSFGISIRFNSDATDVNDFYLDAALCFWKVANTNIRIEVEIDD